MHKKDGCKENEVQAMNGSCKEIPIYNIISETKTVLPPQPQDFAINYRVDKGEWDTIIINAVSHQDAIKYFKKTIRPGLSGLKVEIKIDPTTGEMK
jgi:hypothetical protein